MDAVALQNHTAPFNETPIVDERWGRLAYFDVIQVWLVTPLNRRQRRKLESLLGPVSTVHVHERPMPFHPSFRQRLQIRQPTRKAIAFLRDVVRGEALINAAEIALDFTAQTRDQAESLTGHLQLHWLMRWPGDSTMKTLGRTTYWGYRRQLIYDDKPCRITGELYCVHLEQRIRGAAKCKRIGLVSLADLLTFDFRAFWRRHLRLYAFDPEKLGRAAQGTKRRKPWMRNYGHGIVINWDRRVASYVIHGTQSAHRPMGCVEDVRRHARFDLRRALIPIPTDKFLARL